MSTQSPALITAEPQKKKSIKAFVFLIALPFVLLLLLVATQLIVQFSLNKTTTVQTGGGFSKCLSPGPQANIYCEEDTEKRTGWLVIRILQIIFGIAAAILLLLEPLWIILLVLAINYNSKHFPDSLRK